MIWKNEANRYKPALLSISIGLALPVSFLIGYIGDYRPRHTFI